MATKEANMETDEIPTYKCDYCNVEMEMNNKVSHEAGKKHQNNFERFQHNRCAVTVTGYPPYSKVDDLLQALSKFGEIKRFPKHFRMSRQKQIRVVFNDPKEAELAVKQNGKVHIYGHRLNIEAMYFKRGFENIKNKEDEIDEAVNPNIIDFSGSFMEQVNTILSMIRMTKEEVNALTGLLSDLHSALELTWPGCVAHPFGSITTGLGIKGSDADCYIEVPRRFRNYEDVYVHKAKKVLYRFREVFTDILAVPRASTPIVKFFHIPTKTKCDISFKNFMGVLNSRLLHCLINCDPRLLPLFLIIKYWAKIHNITGRGRFSNYSLNMLIVFYLQQSPHPILPSIEYLQRDCRFDNLCDGWNCGFNHNLVTTMVENDKTLCDLLGDFFKFCAEFDFQKFIVCPYTGEKIDKEDFLDSTKLPDVYKRYKDYVTLPSNRDLRVVTPVCIQDPFYHVHNLSAAVTEKILWETMAHFKCSAKIYEEALKSNKLDTFLKAILFQKPTFNEFPACPEFMIRLKPIRANKSMDTTEDWRIRARFTILTIFNRILKCHIESLLRADINREEPTQDNIKYNIPIKYHCFVTQKLWRTDVRKKLASTVNIASISSRKETISDWLCSYKQDISLLDFDMALVFLENPEELCVRIRCGKNGANLYYEFGQFVFRWLPDWFAKIYHEKDNLMPNGSKMDNVISTLIEARQTVDTIETVKSGNVESSESIILTHNMSEMKEESSVAKTVVANSEILLQSETKMDAS